MMIQMQVYRFFALTKKFSHTHRDLLKMDIEGSEFLVLSDILNTGIAFDQLCIETHTRIFSKQCGTNETGEGAAEPAWISNGKQWKAGADICSC